MSKKTANPLKTMSACHEDVLKQLDKLEKILNVVKKPADLRKKGKDLAVFFAFIGESLALHTRDEEQALFPFLQVKLRRPKKGANGGCASAAPVEVMMADHKEIHALISEMRTFFGLAAGEKNAKFGKILIKTAAEKGRLTGEIFRDHIWKEDNILYPMAKENLSAKELSQIAEIMDSFRQECGFSCQTCG